MLIDQSMYETLQKVEKKTRRNYTNNIYWKDRSEYDGYINGETLFDAVEDLLYEIEEREYDIDRLKQETDPNYDYYEESKIREWESEL